MTFGLGNVAIVAVVRDEEGFGAATTVGAAMTPMVSNAETVARGVVIQVRGIFSPISKVGMRNVVVRLNRVSK